MDKMALAAFNAYYTAKRKFEALRDEESGMETIEAVILIAIAIIVAVLIIQFLTGNSETFGEHGIVGYIFDKIKDQLDDIFGGD
jgi:hypothetical protein